MIPCPKCGHLNEETVRNCANCHINIEWALANLEELQAWRQADEQAAIFWEQRAKKDVEVRPEWEAEKKVARRVYWWLLLSPFVTVPCFGSQVLTLYSATVGERVLAALVPLIFHIPLLFGLLSRSRFVQRHTQQAFILIGLRASMAAISLNLGRDPSDGLWLWFFGNGALWLFGSLWGLNQATRGDCWLMRRRGEGEELPRPWAVPAGVPTTPVAQLPFDVTADPNAAFEDGRRLLRGGKRVEATACFLLAFREGPPDLRHRALAELERLGVVETF